MLTSTDSLSSIYDNCAVILPSFPLFDVEACAAARCAQYALAEEFGGDRVITSSPSTSCVSSSTTNAFPEELHDHAAVDIDDDDIEAIVAVLRAIG